MKKLLALAAAVTASLVLAAPASASVSYYNCGSGAYYFEYQQYWNGIQWVTTYQGPWIRIWGYCPGF